MENLHERFHTIENYADLKAVLDARCKRKNAKELRGAFPRQKQKKSGTHNGTE